MSTEYSPVVYYDYEDYYEGTVKHKARLCFHHTSDTVSWQVQDDMGVWMDRFVLSDEAFDALCKAIRLAKETL